MSAGLFDPMRAIAPVGYHRLHPERGTDFQLHRFLQWVGPSSAEEIRRAGERIAGGADWCVTFLALAQEARTDDRELAAAYYDRAAEFFMAPDDPRRPAARARFVEGVRRLHGLRPVPVHSPDGPLVAYDLPASPPAGEDGTGTGAGTASGTIVVFGGFDEYIEENIPLLVAAAGAGYRIIAFDGPGQGGALEDHGVTLTAAWHRPVAAVLDHFGLDDVTLIGISLGGGLAIRAAAHEPRVSRVVALDVLDDFFECITGQAGPGAGPGLLLLLACGARRVVNALTGAVARRRPIAAWGLRQGMHVTATDDPYGFLQMTRTLHTHDVSHLVEADVLLLAGADDHYVPTRQLYRQARALTNARSVTTRLFTTADHAQNHCQIGNISAALAAIFGWMTALERSRDRCPIQRHQPVVERKDHDR